MKNVRLVAKTIQRLINTFLEPFDLELHRRSKPLPSLPVAPLPEIVYRVQEEIASLCPHSNYAGHYRKFEYAFWSATIPVFWHLSSEECRHKVLDVGCGYGTLLAVLHEMGWDVYGTDILPVTELMGKKTQKRFNIDFQQFNIEKTDLPYGNDEFDFIVLSEIIEHFHFQPIATLRRVLKKVRPGGIVFISTPALGFGWQNEEYTQPFEDIPKYEDSTKNINPHKHMKIYSPEEFERLLNACGGREIFCDVYASPHKSQSHCVGWIRK